MRITKHLILLWGVLVVAAACTDETLQKIDIEKNRGKEVSFTASAQPFTENTRTYYGTPTNGKCPIFWSSKDNIVVASPMGQPGRDNAVYSIEVPVGSSGKPEEGGAYYARDIVLNTNVNQAGVQWGDDPKNGSFYSIYPYSAETLRQPGGSLQNVDHNSITLDDNGKVTATAKIEAEQRIWAPVGTEAKSVTVGSGTSASTYELLNMYGSNHALVMWAQTDNVAHGESVNLRFSPLSTCLMMTFSCTDEIGGDANFPAIVEEITIQADTEIAGDMLITFPEPNEETEATGITGTNQKYNIGTPECTLLNNENASTKIVIVPHILSTDMPSGYSPTIGYSQKMQICAFLFPNKEGYDMSDWTITAKINGKSYSRTMTPQIDTEDNHTILPGQVHQIEFPPFNVTEEWDYDPASWMKDIDDNVYLTQITFPGSWNSYCQDGEDTGGENMGALSQKFDYQTLTFEEQMQAGVRAFDLPTRSGPKEGSGAPDDVFISGTGASGTEAYHSGTSVGDAIDLIAQYVSTVAKTETAVVVLSYDPEGSTGHRTIDYQYWLYGLKKVYDNLTYQSAVYSDKIGPETTLGDVRGKVVLKVNLGDDVCTYFNTNEDYQYTSGLPALFSYSTLKWILTSKVADQNGAILGDAEDYDFTNKSLTTVLGWNEWTGLWNKKLIYDEPDDRSGLYAWNYSCVNRTYPGSGETVTNGLPTIENRKNALNTLVAEASSVYKLGYTNEWFLFGCGGVYATKMDDYSSITSSADWTTWYDTMQENIRKFASDMNPWVNKQIKSFFKDNTPLPLGIVFVNQIGVPEYQGDEILTNLIKMNKAFYLQQKPVQSGGTKSRSTRKNESAAEDSKFKTESNGWTVYSHSGN